MIRRRTTRWTGAAGACFTSHLVRRRLNEIAPPGQLCRYVASHPMGKISVSDLRLATQNEFAFLAELGLPLVEHREFAPESYRGGFELIFGGAGKRVTFLYSDCEFEVRVDGAELFGATKHDSFAGNMFSHEHLLPALPRLRTAVESALRSFATAAT